jgi:hypothetical protein
VWLQERLLRARVSQSYDERIAEHAAAHFAIDEEGQSAEHFALGHAAFSMK